ncbi:hypothetical protein JJV70_10220 [Streptomyces sp. JJ66]|uniref:hypothetical protein n=1 Tax=Streptomyces sp. JJ66 TaxID=2803843 RepID=UPI001C59C1C6|nr:hypothetical protein [Streptomyces sp. JJ66]MBW1602478.1 hypothetical protein [Streptomyces sp. JJ66]
MARPPLLLRAEKPGHTGHTEGRPAPGPPRPAAPDTRTAAHPGGFGTSGVRAQPVAVHPAEDGFRAGASRSRAWPATAPMSPCLLAGEDDAGFEPHIWRGID